MKWIALKQPEWVSPNGQFWAKKNNHKAILWALCSGDGIHDDWVVSCGCGWELPGTWGSKKHCKASFKAHAEGKTA